jgi:protein SCO1/2
MDTTARGHHPFRAIGEYLPAFALYNQRGLVTQSSNLQGSYVVMNFIFTRCMVARMCPLSTQKMRTLAGLLSEASNLPVRLLSVTLDPEYDTPGVFEEYARAYEFSAGSIDFLTGPQQAVSDLKAQLGVLAKADDKLIINHTMMVIVADPLGQISYQVPGSAWSPEAVFEHIQQQAATAQDAKADS